MWYIETHNSDDIIMADRGFTVQHLLNPLHAQPKIPSFLKGRESLSAAEELESRKIAKARIHVEQFRLIEEGYHYQFLQ